LIVKKAKQNEYNSNHSDNRNLNCRGYANSAGYATCGNNDTLNKVVYSAKSYEDTCNEQVKEVKHKPPF